MGITHRLTVQAYSVRAFKFHGNTVFSDEELSAILKPYTGRMLTATELESARVAVSEHYIQHGYINSGAVLEGSPNADGEVIFRVVEGRLTDVTIRGNKWIRESFYRARTGAKNDRPLNVDRLRERLQVWRLYYPIEQVNAELRPGALRGEANLDVTVQESFPYHLGLQWANDRPPSTGSEQVSGLFRADSLTWSGDQLRLQYGIARGQGAGGGEWDFLGTDDLSAGYSIPITAADTRLGLQYALSSAVVLEEPFADLDITAKSEIFGVSLTQPVLRSPTRDWSFELGAEHKSNRDWLLGEPYSFSPGEIDGKSTVSVLRFSTQFIERSEFYAFAARATVSYGIDALDATRNERGPEGQFVALLGQCQYVRRLWNTRHEVLFRAAGQYSPDPLLTLEQLAIGGANTVRGYRENTMLRDNGAFGTAELHLCLWSDKAGRSRVKLVPFASLAGGWNNDRPTADPRDISSAGLGLVLTPVKQVDASLFWGYAFRRLAHTSDDLQDSGIHFKVNVWAF